MLYGLNGSGKSRFLAQVAAAFGSGTPEVAVTLHAQLTDPEYCPPVSDLTMWFWSALLGHSREVAEQHEVDPITLQMVNNRDPQEFNYVHWVSSLLGKGYGLDTAIAAEVAGQGALALTYNTDGAVTLAVGARRLQRSSGDNLSPEFDPKALNPVTLDPDIWPNAIFEDLYRSPDLRLHDADAYWRLDPRPPEWVSFPMLSLSRISTADAPKMFAIRPDGLTLRSRLLASLAPNLESGAFRYDNDRGSHLDPLVDQALSEINSLASEVMTMMLPSGPHVAVSMRDPDSLMAHHPILLEATRQEDQHRLRLEELSEAEAYWYEFAAEVAIARRADKRDAAVVLLDEPDRGLHPQARRRLPLALRRLGELIGSSVLISTHGAEVVAGSTTGLWHVSRLTDGNSVVRRLEAPQLRSLRDYEDLGLLPADVLQFLRVLLVVEGEHDAAVIGTVLANDIAAAGGHIVVLRGTENLSSILDCQLLMQFTDAKVLIVLDNTRQSVVSAWTQARKALRRNSLQEARRLILKAVPPAGASSEEQKLCTFLLDGLTADAHDRIDVIGLTQPDIINYLPVDYFAPAMKSWQEAKDVALREGQPNLKRWLSEAGTPVNRTTCIDAATQLRELPLDLTELRSAIYRAAVVADANSVGASDSQRQSEA